MHKGHRSSEYRFYVAYRKIRFLAKRGSLFFSSKPNGRSRNFISGRTYNIISANSLLLFLIAYLVIYTLNLFITGYAAILFNIPVLVYYNDVDFLIRGIDWTHDSVSGVFSSGPIVMLVLTVFMAILFKSVETESGILRLLLFWMILHSLTRILGEILVGSILNKGFGFVILYMFMMDTGKVVLTIGGFVAMFLAGIIGARPSLFTANIYFNNLLRADRMRFIMSQFVLPFLIGNLVIMAVKIPSFSYFDVALNASMILIIIPILIRNTSIEDLYFDEDPRKVSFNYKILATMLTLLVLFRVVLGIGVRL
ncbi:MAG: hypothetical protein ACOYNC_14545 [Bacteroidales bacterium]